MLLIFAPTADMNAYQVQQAELESARAVIEECDLKIFHLLQVGNAHVDDAKIARSQVEELARKYKVNPRAFMLIIIGKDGTVRLRQNVPIKLTELFSVIDAMRQREIPKKEVK